MTVKKLKITGLVFTIILISIISITFHVYGGELSPELLERLQTIQHKEYISVIVRMTEQANLSFANQGVVGRRKSLQSMNVIRALKVTAATAQKNINRFLEKEKEKGNVEHYTSFWIFNGLILSATPQVIKKIAMRDDIETITEDLPIAPPVLFSSPPLQSDPLCTWNIKRIKAPEVWNKGYDGKGIVVGIFDSGVDYTHPDLKDRYRGGNNSWFDPHGEHNLPYDSAGHGTMITGIILGGNAHGKNIGVLRVPSG